MAFPARLSCLIACRTHCIYLQPVTISRIQGHWLRFSPMAGAYTQVGPSIVAMQKPFLAANQVVDIQISSALAIINNTRGIYPIFWTTYTLADDTYITEPDESTDPDDYDRSSEAFVLGSAGITMGCTTFERHYNLIQTLLAAVEDTDNGM
jgi:hypothetical protein